MAALASLKAYTVRAAWSCFWGAATCGGASSSAIPAAVWGGLLMQAGAGVCAPTHAAGEFDGMEQMAKGEMGQGQ